MHLLTDSKLLFIIISKDSYTSKKRVMIDIYAVRHAYNSDEIYTKGFKCSSYNLAKEPINPIMQASLMSLNQEPNAQNRSRAMGYPRCVNQRSQYVFRWGSLTVPKNTTGSKEEKRPEYAVLHSFRHKLSQVEKAYANLLFSPIFDVHTHSLCRFTRTITTICVISV